ncbi:MAG: Tm-1-like ATP-binding domain-containing protein, partial [Pseudomonadota bacterium]
VRFFLPEGGVSALDAPGQPFHDPEANAALFKALTQTVRETSNRQLIRTPHNINDPEFSKLVVQTFRSLHGSAPRRAAGGGA